MIVKKLFSFLSSLFLVITVTFFLMHTLPGDPFSDEKTLSKEVIEAMQAHYGLDRPLLYQYFSYLKGLCLFDFGPSLRYPDRLVSSMIGEGMATSCLLGLEALMFSLGLGVLLGFLSVLCKNRLLDHLLLLFSTLSLAIPSFLLATLLQHFFAVKCSLLPVARWDTFTHSILPALTLSLLPTFFIARLTRASMLDVLSQEFIQTAKAKGLSPLRVLRSHVLKNAFLPILAYVGPLTASILTGGFAVEKIFGIPGLGQWFVLSVLNRDYTMIMGTSIVYTALFMSCILVADVLSALLDPRIKQPLSSGEAS